MKRVFDPCFKALLNLHCLWQRRSPGQGLVEYAGALCVAGLLVGAVVLGTSSGGWMSTAYTAIMTAAGNMLVSMAGQIGA